MLLVDKSILDTDKVICANIAVFRDDRRGLLSQNILAQLRNYIEYIVQKIYSQGEDINPNHFSHKKEAWQYVKTKGELRFLSQFHSLLQTSVSHYTLDENGSERLMLKYYEYLLKIKSYLKKNYDLNVLENITDFPLNLDTNLIEYYEKIVARIENPSNQSVPNPYRERFYIQKVKPFFIDTHIYYEITFTIANDKASKFDRIIAFTNLEISDNYAVKLKLRNDFIKIMDKYMPIQIIDQWEVSIRPCEINNFSSIFGIKCNISPGFKEYQNVMQFLTQSRMSLLELINSSDSYYRLVEDKCKKNVQSTYIFDVLDKSRKIIKEKSPGFNVICYLLHKMNNKIIRQQYYYEGCIKLSRLHLSWGCIPFDTMPFTSSLIGHNPRSFDLFQCIDLQNREHEFFARIIKNNTEHQGKLFTPLSDLSHFNNIEKLQRKYNSLIYIKKHASRCLKTYKDHFYIEGYVNDTKEIIKKIKQLSFKGIEEYKKSAEDWISNNLDYNIDCSEKKDALKKMFSDSQVALVYGSAGTGKSTLINHISQIYNNRGKLYLANTNPAVDNLKRKVNTDNGEFKTITKFLSSNNQNKEYDIIFIDECSTVSNEYMRRFLEEATFRLLILVGDVFQIESILFGNWFNIARAFISKNAVFELQKTYRSTNPELLTVWDRVRRLDNAILEPMVKNEYSAELSKSMFEQFEEDEIILCLNYDGLYGINNINRFLQSSNVHPVVTWE